MQHFSHGHIFKTFIIFQNKKVGKWTTNFWPSQKILMLKYQANTDWKSIGLYLYCQFLHGVYSSVSRFCGNSSLSVLPSSFPLASHLLQGKVQDFPRDGQSMITLSNNQSERNPESSWLILKTMVHTSLSRIKHTYISDFLMLVSKISLEKFC